MTYRLYAFLSIVTMCILVLVLWQNWTNTILWITELQTNFHRLLTTHIRQYNENTVSSGFVLILASLAYGIFHAAGPGHGKAVLITYLSTQKESFKQGIVISFAAAIVQAFVAITIVTILSVLLNKTLNQTNLVSLRTEQSSYILVLLLGAYFIYQSLRKLKGLIDRQELANEVSDRNGHHRHDQQAHVHQAHDHQTHSHDCCHHTYVPETKISKWQTLGVILSMGARPCTGAIVVLIYTKVIGIYWVGVIATLLMGVGTGLTVSVLGILTIFFREKISQLIHKNDDSKEERLGFTSVLLTTMGGVLLISVGWSLLQASMSPAAQHPLL